MSCKECEEKHKAEEKAAKLLTVRIFPYKEICLYVALTALLVAYYLLVDMAF